MMQQKKRIVWLDMAKGYGMIFVILGHLGLGKFGRWLYTFHIPLFFLLAGYVFHSNCDLRTFVKKKCRSLLIPYWGLGIPILFLEEFSNQEHFIPNAGHYIRLFLKFVLQRRRTTLWFVACLFFLNILFYLTQKVLKTNRKLALFSIASVTAGLVYYKFIGVSLPWNVDVCLMAYPFFFAGYLYKSNHTILDRYFDSRTLSVILFAVLGFVNVFFGNLNVKISGAGLEMYSSRYGCAPLTYISAFAGIACVIIASKWITLRPIRYIGENSVLYLALHPLLIPVSADWLDFIHNSVDSANILGNRIIYTVIRMLIILAIISVVNHLVSRTRLKVLLGK